MTIGVEINLSSLSVKDCCSRGTETLWKSNARKASAVGSRYQRTGEETADLEESVPTVVNCRMFELAISPE
jgi:hypothetical protein